MKTKSDTIAEIMQLNPTVGAAFLSEFNNDDLVLYLRRLSDLRESRRPRVRTAATPAARSRPDALQSA
jgi:hypothetical protein